MFCLFLVVEVCFCKLFISSKYDRPMDKRLYIFRIIKNTVSCFIPVACPLVSTALEEQLRPFKPLISNVMHLLASDNNQCLTFHFGAILAVSQNWPITLYTSSSHPCLPPSLSVFFFLSPIREAVNSPFDGVTSGIGTGEWSARGHLD